MQALKDRIVACFCGCSELTVKEVKLIVSSPIGSFLKQSQAKTLFRNFIIHELHDEEDNLILKYLVTTEHCYEFLSVPMEERDEGCLEKYQELIETFPSYTVEKRVTEAFEDQDNPRIESELKRLIRSLEIEIESSQELKHFKEKLMQKIDRATTARKKK